MIFPVSSHASSLFQPNVFIYEKNFDMKTTAKIPSEMDVAPLYIILTVDTVFTVDTVNTVNTVFILFKLLYTAPQLAGMPIHIVGYGEGENAIGMS